MEVLDPCFRPSQLTVAWKQHCDLVGHKKLKQEQGHHQMLEILEGEVKRGKFHPLKRCWCWFPEERLPTPLRLTLSSRCDTMTLTVSSHVQACCIFLLFTHMCVTQENRKQARNTISARQQKIYDYRHSLQASFSLHNAAFVSYLMFSNNSWERGVTVYCWWIYRIYLQHVSVCLQFSFSDS